MIRTYLILLFLLSITSLCIAQKLCIDTICYNHNKFDCGLVYQVKYDSGETDTMFITGGKFSTDIKHQFFGTDTLVILQGSLVAGRADLSCSWYIRNEKNARAHFGWKWEYWRGETFYSFMASSDLPVREGRDYIPQKVGRVPNDLDNLVIAGYGNIYEMVDGEKISYGKKYFDELENGAQADYPWGAASLLAKHIGKENLDPKVARWYYKE